MLRVYIGSIFLFMFIAASLDAQQSGLSPDRLQRYEDFLQKEIDNKKMAGCVSLVYRKGEIAHFEALGYDNLDTKVEMTSDQLFYLQSMTKPIVSAAFMMLYEEGHFFLDDPVSKYLDGFDSLTVVSMPEGATEPIYEPAKEPVRIWHLLSHTAGFSHGLGNNPYDKEINKRLYQTQHKDIEARVKALVSYPLMGHPGEQWNYSASPDVLALLIQKFSGQTPADFLQERIFSPLGMNNTGYNISDEQAKRQADLHAPVPGVGLIVADYTIPTSGNTVFGGTHGLFGTAEDYLKFARMMMNNGTWEGRQYLSRKTIELMTENFVGDKYGEGEGFGLGFGVVTDLSDYAGTGSVGQHYWNGAFNTHFFIDKEEQMISILMTQTYPYSDYYADKMRQFVYSAIAD